MKKRRCGDFETLTGRNAKIANSLRKIRRYGNFERLTGRTTKLVNTLMKITMKI